MVPKLKKPVPDRDRVVVIEDNGTADIATIYDSDDQALYAESPTQDYAVPIADLTAFVGPSGRIYVLHAASDYVADTKRLAALERSIVLRQVTHFTKPLSDDKGGINLKQILMYLAVGVLLLAVIFK